MNHTEKKKLGALRDVPQSSKMLQLQNNTGRHVHPSSLPLFLTLCYFYLFQSILELNTILHDCILIDTVGFNLTKNKAMGKEPDWPSCHCECMWTVHRNHHSVIKQDAFLYHLLPLDPITLMISSQSCTHDTNTLIPAECRDGPQLYSYHIHWTNIIYIRH